MRTKRTPITPAVLATVVLVAGCASSVDTPERVPDAVGTASSVETVHGVTNVGFAHDEGYEYFEGTVFVLDGEVSVTGAATEASAIVDGDRLEVWADICAESFPVQCQVQAVRVGER